MRYFQELVSSDSRPMPSQHNAVPWIPPSHTAATDLKVSDWLQHVGGRQNLKLASRRCSSPREIKNSIPTKTNKQKNPNNTFFPPKSRIVFVPFDNKKIRVREEQAKFDNLQKPWATHKYYLTQV